MKKIGVVRFPGTNCDQDVLEMCLAKNYEAKYAWHLDQFDSKEFDMLILPGGFSYGDYLRSGALSARSPVMNSVKSFADYGGPVLGICNGFQILTESRLLPGALLKNKTLRFCDDWVDVEVKNDSPFFAQQSKNRIFKIPIAHGDGCYYADQSTIKKMQDNEQIWLTYKKNPNGSVYDIAGVMNEKKNVAALMPHPERAIYDWMGSVDGWEFLP